MITLHHLNNSRSQRIIWLLEELSVDYRIEHYQRDAQTSLAPESLKKIHPLGKSPVITDDAVLDNNGKPQVIAESGVIIDYLISQYGNGQFKSSEGQDYWQYQYWLHYSEGSLMPLLVMSLILDKIKTAPMPFFIRPIAKKIADGAMAAYAGPNIARNLTYIEQHLAGKSWFVGDALSGADFQMIFPLEAVLSRAAKREDFPNIARFVDQIHGLENYQKALQAGGPYDYA